MLLPLYPKLPLAAVQDPALYELLALFDALRIGQARERDLARTLLERVHDPSARMGELRDAHQNLSQ